MSAFINHGCNPLLRSTTPPPLQDDLDTFKRISSGTVTYPSFLSPESIDLIACLLEKDPGTEQVHGRAVWLQMTPIPHTVHTESWALVCAHSQVACSSLGRGTTAPDAGVV